MTITPQLLELLKQIDRGETAFKREGETPDDLRRFRNKVRDLRRLQRLGYIKILELRELHETANFSRPSYDAALISLTDHGRKFLAETHPAEREK